MHISVTFYVLVASSVLGGFGPFGPQVSGEETAVLGSDPPLRVGTTVQGEVLADSEIIRSSKLGAGYSDAPVRGVRFAFEVQTPGQVTIDLKSYSFDAYLVVRDSSGRVIAEDDDGLVSSHARLVLALDAGAYGVVATALHGGKGPFELELRAGAPELISPSARIEAEIDDARRAVEVRTARLGDHADTASSLNHLGLVCESQGLVDDAESHYLRALRIVESLFGLGHPDTANSLGNLGMLYYQQRRYAEAEPLYVRLLEIDESTLGPDHPSAAASMTNVGLLYELQGRAGEAEPLYRRALEIHESVLGPEHPSTATSLDYLGLLYKSQGRYGEAEPLHLRALEIHESALGPEHSSTATSLNNLALLYEFQGRYGEAEPLYLRALKIDESVLGSEDPSTATSLNNLAALYYQQSRYADAGVLYLRALAIYEKALGPDHPLTATGLNNLALLYESQGRYAEAESLYRRALKIRESTLGLAHRMTAASLNNLAVLYELQMRYSEAERFHQRSLAIHESISGPDHPDTAASLNNLAGLYKSQGRYLEAEPFYLRALRIHESALGSDHPRTATSLSNLAGLYRAQGRYADSQPLFLRAVAIRESVLGSSHPLTASSLNHLGTVCRLQARYAEAEPLFLRALEIRESLFGPDHPDVATTLSNVSLMLYAQGRFGEAFPYVDRLLVGGHSWTLRELSTSTSDRRFFVAGTEQSHVDIALSLWSAAEGSRPGLDEVYGPICAWKGVVFRHVTRLSRELSVGSENDPEIGRLRGTLADLDGRLSKLAYAERIADPAAHKTRLAELRAQRGEAQLELLSRMVTESARESSSAAELSRLLPERSVLLDFLIHRPWRPQPAADGGLARASDPRLLCFVTTSGRAVPELLDLGEVEPIRSALEARLESMTGGRRGIQVVVVEEVPGVAIRELLFDPILAAIPADTTRLFVIPDGFIGQVPFGAIPLGDGRFVLETMDVVYATDPVTLRDRLEAKPRGEDAILSVLAVGGVDFDERGDLPEDASVPSDRGRGGTRAFSRSWGPLPGTAEEVSGLSLLARRTHAEAEPARILSGAAATEEAVKSRAAGKTILHFATHGFFEREGLVSRWQTALEHAHEDHEAHGFAASSQSTNPYRGQDVFAHDRSLEGEEPGLLAGLVFAGANRDSSEDPSRDDGILTATEVSGLDLSACRLAVLSACQSSLGTGQSGEGLQSLRRGFQEAGAQSVIASLWKVDDEATQQLMHAFYEELWTNKRGVGDALRRARLKLLREKKDPYYWGAFTLSGEWR